MGTELSVFFFFAVLGSFQSVTMAHNTGPCKVGPRWCQNPQDQGREPLARKGLGRYPRGVTCKGHQGSAQEVNKRAPFMCEAKMCEPSA